MFPKGATNKEKKKKNYLWVHYQYCWKHNHIEELWEQKFGDFYYVSKMVSISYLTVFVHLKQLHKKEVHKITISKYLSVSFCQEKHP